MTITFCVCFNLLHLPSLGIFLKCYLGEAAAASYPARFKAHKEDYLQLSQNWLWLSHLLIPEWVGSEELISLVLVTWGSTQTTWTESRENTPSGRKLSSFQKKLGTQMPGKGDINSTVPSSSASYPIHYQACRCWTLSPKELSAQYLHQKLLGSL